MPRYATGESMLRRAVRIIDALDNDEPALTVSELAREAGLHVATASRLIAEMVSLGLLVRGEDGRIRVGLRMWELGSRASPATTLREAAMPIIHDVHAVVGHHAQLSVLEGREVLFLERLSAPGSGVNYSVIAGRLPLHASSAGHVLLANAPASVQDEVLAGPLEAFTAETITSPAELRAALARVRREGFALLAGHLHPSAAGVAVPLRDRRNRVIAAFSVVLPNDGSATGVAPMLMAASRGISRAIATGGRRESDSLKANSQSLRTM